MNLETSQKHAKDSSVSGDIAIVGMSCLFAGAPDLDTYWRNIVSKVDSISDPPAGEWDPKIFYDPTSKSNDRVYCKRGGYIGDLASFRPLDFGVMPITVDGGEPDQWLSLRVAYEALADAGYSELPKEHERTEVILGKGTYVNRGNLTVGYHGMVIEYFLQVLKNLHPEYSDSELEGIKQELKAGLPPFSADTAPALIGNIIAGRIANRLDLMGSSFTVDAACASALLAIEIGIRDLLTHKCDLVLAGGANANAPLPTLSLFCQLGALSRQEQIRPFDKTADGTILGEGLGIIILKRREDAERDGNRIYAFIKGVGIASDGRALHVMAPRMEGEELALKRAYEMAGFSPTTVSLIEAHGTATPVGDMVEIQALSKVFGERASSLPTCAIGSVKSMIGHTMPAAGIAGVIKTALALHHRVLPPTINCDEPNPAMHLERTPFYVNTETRPWFNGADTPRRAGVNSFGFGGINGHVVLEETNTDGAKDHGYLLDWESEVCILEAASRTALIDRAGALVAYLKNAAEIPLKDIAYSLNTGLSGGPSRLAVIATTKEDLAEKLAHATTRLSDPKLKQIKDNRGIYFFEERLEGKLAFIFPGEGAQYQNMLLDLCLHFPEVRECFDLADRALLRSAGKRAPSEFIFPRSILSAAERAEVEKSLWQIDGAVEAVLIANRAMSILLNRLKINPDVIMGHSTGDYSAMLASNVIQLTSEANYVETILAWNQAHGRLAGKVLVPEVVLLAVAADSNTVMSIVAELGGELYLAMANCPHQSVLVGRSEAIDRVIEVLRQRALMYEILPFDRPYHTPMFQAYAERAGDEFFSNLPISAPRTPVYSCTTAALYPSTVPEIRELFIAHWVRPVLFTETVEAMYADGVRFFVEAGPRGNLTAFVSDILRGKPHLAMPANIARRSGISQINHLVGVLAAQGVPMNLDYLFARREPQLLEWDNADWLPVSKKLSAPMSVSLAIPALAVARRERKEKPAAIEVREQLTMAATVATAAPMAPAAPVVHPGVPALNPAARAMQEYVKGMKVFIDAEQEVMQSFLKRSRGAGVSMPVSGKKPVSAPLLGTITSLTPGQELTAVRHLSLEEDLFLREHALGGPVSMTDPSLRPMMVLPLTMSMEILAEAGAALMPGSVLTGMREIQANHWIRVDDVPVELRITARRVPGSTNEIDVEIRDGQAKPAVRGIMSFGQKYASAPRAVKTALTSERKSKLAGVNLYDGKLMFHGPAFQGVASVDHSGKDGVAGTLQVLSSRGMFRSDPHPRFVTDPVALDAAGQLVGFWAAEYLPEGFVVFPYRLESLQIYGPARPVGETLACRVALQLLGTERVRSTIEIIGADELVWMRLEGWEDRRFDPPKRFHRAWIAPQEAMIGEAWPVPLAGLASNNTLECYRVENLFQPGNGLWQELWASLVLTRKERAGFHQLQEPEKRKLDWLSGRTAAKDAMRKFLQTNHGMELLPADIEIAQDANGRLFADGPWINQLRTAPGLSLTHSNGLAVALAGEGVGARHFAIDVKGIGDAAQDGAPLTQSEHLLLNTVPAADRSEWLLRMWCTKEAVAKALGTALMTNASGVVISSLDLATGIVRSTGDRILTYTAREGKYVVATTILEREKL